MKDKIIKISELTDWTLIKEQDNIKMMQFQNGANKLNIYWGTMTVAVLYKNQEPRYFQNVNLDLLRELLGARKQSILQKFLSIFK